MKYALASLLLFISGSALAATDYDQKLKDYVEDRVWHRVENGSEAPGLKKLVSATTNFEMSVDVTSLRCLGYASPNGNGKAVGVCVFRAYDTNSGGDRFEANYLVSISDDLEHRGISRTWDVRLQQAVYF